MIPAEAVEAAAKALRKKFNGYEVERAWDSRDQRTTYHNDAIAALEAAAPYVAFQSGAVEAVLRLHRAAPCMDEDGEPVGGFYCEECKDLDDHSGERVHEVFPCLTVREIRAALAGEETYTAMRDRIEAGVRK